MSSPPHHLVVRRAQHGERLHKALTWAGNTPLVVTTKAYGVTFTGVPKLGVPSLFHAKGCARVVRPS